MFKRTIILCCIILTQVSNIYPDSIANRIEKGNTNITKSRIIISGRSSIIIESENEKTNILVSKIEEITGGKLCRFSGKKVDIELDSNKSYNEAFGVLNTGLPTEFKIDNAYPNPFNPTTTISYGIPNQTNVEVAIYDMKGRLVRADNIGDKSPGWHEFKWQGNDSYGQQVSTGMYLVTMRAGDNFQKQKVTFLK